MKARVRRFAVTGLLALSVIGVMPGAALADTRCSGSPGVEVFENINLGGRSALGCSVGWARTDFSNWATNLGWFETWNDRISSYQVFNFYGHRLRFWTAANYSGSVITTTGTVPSGTETINNVDDYGTFNDRFSSGKIVY